MASLEVEDQFSRPPRLSWTMYPSTQFCLSLSPVGFRFKKFREWMFFA
jgi:hypothetical protein